MSWLIQALGDPVLAWEVKRTIRGTLWRGLSLGYCAWLLVQALILFTAVASTAANEDPWEGPLSHLEHLRARDTQILEFLGSYLEMLLKFQLVLVISIAPALTASSLGQEKERGTLFALFCTELTSRQILLGMLLGRLILLIPIILTTVPALVFIATFTGRGLTLLVMALVQEMIMALAVGAAGLLFGIWIRRATDAVLAAYFFLGLGYVIIRGFAGPWPEAYWLHPVENLENLFKEGLSYAFVAHLGLWMCLGAGCLWVGCGRLRQVCVEQQDKKPSRRLWAFRPPVGSDPIRWRECYVIGLAPLPILRIVPRWLALLVVFAFAAGLAGMVANQVSPGFLTVLLKFEFAAAFAQLRARGDEIKYAVWSMGLVFILLSTLLLGIRCGTSVAEEKRQHTWDDLLLTAQSFREIITGKMWGILQATVPYIIAYALPVFFLAWLGGPAALLAAVMWIFLPCSIVFFAALIGIDMVTVPPDMDETRETGAFWFERHERRRQLTDG